MSKLRHVFRTSNPEVSFFLLVASSGFFFLGVSGIAKASTGQSMDSSWVFFVPYACLFGVIIVRDLIVTYTHLGDREVEKKLHVFKEGMPYLLFIPLIVWCILAIPAFYMRDNTEKV
jgi:hypothetical protein